MEFSGQEYWSKFPFPSPGDLPDSGIEPGSPALQADFLSSEPPGMPINRYLHMFTGFPGGASGKEPDCQCRRCKRHGSGLRRSPGRRHSNPLQYSCLENPMDRGAWWLQSMGFKEPNTTEQLSTYTIWSLTHYNFSITFY